MNKTTTQIYLHRMGFVSRCNQRKDNIYIYLYTLQFKEKAHITNPRNGLCESGLYGVWLFWNINTELSQTNKLYVPAEENDTRNKTKPITNEIANSLMRDIPLVKKR